MFGGGSAARGSGARVTCAGKGDGGGVLAPLAAGYPQRPGDQPWAGLGPVLGGGDGPVVALAPVPQELAELHSGRIQLVLQALHRVTVWEPLKYPVLLAKHQPLMVGFVTGRYGYQEPDQR